MHGPWAVDVAEPTAPQILGHGATMNGAAGRGRMSRWHQFYLDLPRRGQWRGSVTPRFVARQAMPRHRPWASHVPRHPLYCVAMHGTTK